MYLEIIYLICMYLILNNLQWLIIDKNKPKAKWKGMRYEEAMNDTESKIMKGQGRHLWYT